VYGSIIFLTSSVKLFTKCESFPRFTTNVFGTDDFKDEDVFLAPPGPVFSSFTACVRFFFLLVFAILSFIPFLPRLSLLLLLLLYE
jgi:hypothetical protein